MSPAAQFNAAAATTLALGVAMVALPATSQPLWYWLFYGEMAPAWATPEAARYIAFTYSVIGAVIAGWGALLLWLGLGPLARGERWAWNAAAASVGIWYGLDSSVSLAWGYWQNAALNTVFMLAFASPLWRMRRVKAV